MPVTEKALTRAHSAVLSAEELSRVRGRRRDELIRTATAQGMPQVKIAAVLGLTKQRVQQIVHSNGVH